jgi:DNA-3-methyladenine glycosylase I
VVGAAIRFAAFSLPPTFCSLSLRCTNWRVAFLLFARLDPMSVTSRSAAGYPPYRRPMTGRCPWADQSPAMRAYHDREWGRPVRGDARLFERITLEGAQAGLSWATILNKRPAYRTAFAGFRPERVARFTARDERRLLADTGIVRNRAKIRSTITNARAYLDLRDEVGSVARWLGTFDDPAALSKALRARGFTFVGPTIAESIMHATGVVNGHLPGCALASRSRSRRVRAVPAGGARGGRSGSR